MGKVSKFEKYKKEMEAERERMKDPEYAAAKKMEREQSIKDYWMTLKPFENCYDVPQIPKFDIEFFQKRLIELGAIPLDKMEVGEWYYGDNRNASFGKWNGENFDHLRYSFTFYWDTSEHFQKDDGFALFTPLRKATQEEINKELSKVK